MVHIKVRNIGARRASIKDVILEGISYKERSEYALTPELSGNKPIEIDPDFDASFNLIFEHEKSPKPISFDFRIADGIERGVKIHIP